MKKTLAIITALMIGSLTSLFAQNEIDALRYSRLTPTGTARYVAVGGAFGALGADFTTLSHNPAGIGVYKSSEITFTPSIFQGRSQSDYFDLTKENDRYNFNIGNAGFVLVTNPGGKSTEAGWKNFQFGFGVNRLANFNNRISIEGFNESSSYLTPYVNEANANHYSLDELDNFGSGLAYDVFLMGFDSAANEYFIDMPNGGVLQSKYVSTTGSINEMVFSVGGNYNDRVYLGATIGVPFLRYDETAVYREVDTENRNAYLNNFERIDELTTTGNGVNLKAGIIVRAADWFRIGAAIETPTFYTLSDEYSSTMKANFDTLFDPQRKKVEGFYEYELNTPFKAMFGVGLVLGKAGLISADYEYIDYTAARLRSSDYDFQEENDAIRNDYMKAHNIRLGTEWRYGMIAFRGGYGISANPYKENTNSVMTSYSLGIGLRGSNFFADLGWMNSNMDDEYYLYNAPQNADQAFAKTKIESSSFLLTLGLKF
ncbi:MAG: OmpP1/FadL family transporter [Chloroflexota bacterium]